MTHFDEMVAAGLCSQLEVDYSSRFRLTTTYNDGMVTHSHFEEFDTAVYWAQRWARSFLGHPDAAGGATCIEVNDMHHPDEMMMWYGNNHEQGFTAYADTL